MGKETAIFIVTELGVVCQFIGICIGTWTLWEFRAWVKNGFGRIAGLNSTMTVEVKAPVPWVVATDMSKEMAAVHEELRKLREEVKGERAKRIKASTFFEKFSAKARCGAWFLLVGTVLVALAEWAKFAR